MKKIAISPRLLAAIILAACLVVPLGYFLPPLGHAVQTIGLFFFPGLCIVSLTRLNVHRPVLLFVITVAASVAADLIIFGAIDFAALPLGSQSILTPYDLSIISTTLWVALCAAVYFAGGEIRVWVPSGISARDVFLLCCAASALAEACAGALILNDGGNGDWALIAYAFVGVTFLAMVGMRNPPTPMVSEATLVLLGAALLLSNALRSSYVSAADINYEYQISSMVQARGIWDPSSFHDAYMACLSSSLLPVLVSNFSGASLLIVFKDVMPLLFALIVVLVMDLSRLLVSERGAIAAAFIFVVQPAFQQWVSIPVRVEVAFLLFALSLWALLVPRTVGERRALFFWISSAGMMISHYTTSYIACFIYLVILSVRRFVSWRARGPASAPNKLPSSLAKGILSWPGVIALSVAALLWYGPVAAHGTAALSEYAMQISDSLPQMLDPSVQQQGQSPLNGFGLLSASHPANVAPAYIKQTTAGYQAQYGSSSLLGPLSSSSSVQEMQLVSLPSHEPWITILSALRSVAKLLAMLLIGVGAVTCWRRRTPDLVLVSVIGTFVSSIILILTPFMSVDYDLNRLFQQLLILMAPVMVIGATALWKRRWRHKPLVAGGLVVLYFSLLSRAVFQLAGGPDVSMTFNNRGSDYANYYVTSTDVAAGSWLSSQWESTKQKPLVFADQPAATRLRLVAPIALSQQVKPDVLPSTFVKGSYLFLDSANISTGGVVRVYGNQSIGLSIDYKYFDANLNRVYSTSNTAVYTGR